MRKAIFAVAGIGLVLVAADNPAKPNRVQWNDIGLSVIVVGELGLPVGEEMTIHGKTVFTGKGSNMLHVDRVNGKPFQPGRTISVDGIQDWPLGAEVELRGYEKGSLEFTDIQNTGFSNHDPRFVLRQHLYLWFHPKEVVKPKNLKLGKGRH